MFHKGLDFRPHGDGGAAVDVHEHATDNSQIIRTVMFSQDELLQLLDTLLPSVPESPVTGPIFSSVSEAVPPVLVKTAVAGVPPVEEVPGNGKVIVE